MNRGGPIPWPPRSPDFNPYFFVKQYQDICLYCRYFPWKYTPSCVIRVFETVRYHMGEFKKARPSNICLITYFSNQGFSNTCLNGLLFSCLEVRNRLPRFVRIVSKPPVLLWKPEYYKSNYYCLNTSLCDYP